MDKGDASFHQTSEGRPIPFNGDRRFRIGCNVPIHHASDRRVNSLQLGESSIKACVLHQLPTFYLSDFIPITNLRPYGLSNIIERPSQSYIALDHGTFRHRCFK